MASKPIAARTNGSAQRKCHSFIESFVEWGSNLETPPQFLKWAAISAIGALLEQRCFVVTSRQLFPNLYTMLVGPPGVGKSVAIRAIAELLRKIEFKIGPTSVSGASLIDAVAEAKRTITGTIDKPLIMFNSLFICPDDLQGLLAKYDNELVANLTIFYDTIPYVQTRRTESKRVEINSPQLSILSGETPSHLLSLLPPGAWDQGFMSRTLMIWGEERPLKDDIFAETSTTQTEDLEHDLRAILGLRGQFAIDDDFRSAVNDWRKSSDAPTHPRLVHYNTRRVAHLLKLSMVSAADRSDDLQLKLSDFDRALSWLTEAERDMPRVFAGPATTDARAMQEILHLIGKAEVSETKLIRLTSERVSGHMVKRTVELLEQSGQIEATRISGGIKYFRASSED